MKDFEITLKNYRAFSQQSPLTLNISKGITFLLGINNVGKSTILRAFYDFRNAVMAAPLQQVAQAGEHQTKSNLPEGITFDRIVNRSALNHPIEISFSQKGAGWRFEITPDGDPHTQRINCKINRISGLTASNEFSDTIHAIFRSSMHVGSFRSPAVQAKGSLLDMHIGTNFVHEWDAWANGRKIDHSNQVELLIDELRDLFGYKKFHISVSQDRTQLDLTTDEGKFALSELGDGIAHYIVVLGNAMIRRPKFIFIDEPEIGLHPKMQEMFVRTLASKAQFGLIATSHSVGLGRSTADKTFAVTSDNQGRRKCLPYGEHRKETLMQGVSELCYSQYAEIGGNHLLLVEGRTDIKSFREILRKFGLDQHFLIWSLNGSDWVKADPTKIIDELNELKRLNARSISIIVDSERTSEGAELEPQLARFTTLCTDLGFNVFATDRHSTENYVTQAALDNLGLRSTALGPFEDFNTKTNRWDKNQNWLLFQRMKTEDFEGTRLKDFILGTLKPSVEAANANHTS